MITPLLGGCGQISGSTTANQWINPWGVTDQAATAVALGDVAGRRALIVSAAGTIKNLRVALSGTVGTGRNITFTVTKNGVDTAITLTITDPATTGTDLTHSFTVVAGDIIEIRVVQSSNTANIVTARYGLEFNSTTAGQTFVGAGSATTGPNTGSTSYMAPFTGGGGMGSDFVWSTTRDINHEDIAPVAGLLTGLYVSLVTAPAAGKQWVFSYVINGVEDTSTRVTIANAATTGNVTGLTVAIAEGDTVAIQAVPTGTPTAAAGVRHAAQFSPTTDGQSPLCGHQFNNSFNAASTNRYPAVGGYHSFGNNANVRNGLVTQSVAISRLRWELSAAPGASKTTTVAGRINDAATSNISIAIADPATSGSDLTHSDAIVAGDAYEWQSTHTAATASASMRYGAIAFITTPSTPAYSTFGVMTRLHKVPV